MAAGLLLWHAAVSDVRGVVCGVPEEYSVLQRCNGHNIGAFTF
jgi:hypothetical protein